MKNAGRVSFGLIGTITRDEITYESGSSFSGLGGVLYQAAFLCGFGEDVFLFANLARQMASEVKQLFDKWPTLHTTGIKEVPGPGNRVILHYPNEGERREVLESVVPPLDPERVIAELPRLGMLVLVVNSGFDIEVGSWRKIVRSAACPLWLDFHSLSLARKLHVHREYRVVDEWREWAGGVDYLQANRQELASVLGHPDELPSEAELSGFGRDAFEIGAKAVFVTLGKEGVLVLTPGQAEVLRPTEVHGVVDTTGCGDVFGSATAVMLIRGASPIEAASFGILVAGEAAALSGVEETYNLALRQKPRN